MIDGGDGKLELKLSMKQWTPFMGYFTSEEKATRFVDKMMDDPRRIDFEYLIRKEGDVFRVWYRKIV